MKHIEDNQFRKRENATATYYVLGDKVRNDFLVIVAELQDVVALNQLPDNWNKNDADALETMCHWLAEQRDFNARQLTKFFKMLSKFGLPDNFNALGKQLGWEMGRNLTKSEMFEVMQERRDIARQQKVEADATIELKTYTRKTTYETLFTEDE